MKIHRFRTENSTCFLILAIVGILMLGVLYSPVSNARGQSIEEGWSPPVNLSQSGGATSPIMFIDEGGITHVFWIDEFAGYMYSSGDGNTWSERTKVYPPFDPYSPKLLLGSNNRVHAFWIDEQNNLIWSRAVADQLTGEQPWITPGLLAESVVDFSVQVDDQGVIEVSYIYTESEDGLAAGVNYLRAVENGTSWAAPVSLYNSPYMRSLTSDIAHIELVSTELGEGNWVFTGWDNQVRKEIFLARSLNGGQTWDEPFLVDGPDPSDPSMVPFNLHIAAFEENALLVWQRGRPGGGCSVFYRWSGDGGNSWSDSEQMPGVSVGCPQEINLFDPGEGYVLLVGSFPSQVLFQAWDGTKWSDPQLQSQLSRFEDPETFNIIEFACLQFGNNLSTRKMSVVGCEGSGGDIWFTERNMGDTASWYPPPPVWTDPVAISEAESEFDTPILVSGQNEMLHAFWSQISEGNNTRTSVTGIYYAQWDGERWSRPSSILNTSEGSSSQLFAVLDQNDHLLVAWIGSDTGLVYFSKVAASQALRASDWTIPEPLPLPVPGGKSPHILPVGANQIYVTYAVPFNEARGIYMVTSVDSGITWSPPAQIYDAAIDGWDMVDFPILSMAADGSLHAVFTRYSLPGGSGSMGMYYSRSVNGGNTWSEPELLDQNPVYWSQIVSGRDGILHRLWQARTTNSIGFVFRHQYSLDHGENWSPPATISNLSLADSSATASLAVTSTGVLHLLHTIQNTTGEDSVAHWVWTGDQWMRREDLRLNVNQGLKLAGLSAAASSTGRSAVIYSVPTVVDASQNIPEFALVFRIRALDITLPPSAALPSLVPSPTPISTPGSAEELTITPTPALDLTTLANQEPPQPIPSRWESIGVGLSLAVILVGIAFGIGVRSMKSKK